MDTDKIDRELLLRIGKTGVDQPIGILVFVDSPDKAEKPKNPEMEDLLYERTLMSLESYLQNLQAYYEIAPSLGAAYAALKPQQILELAEQPYVSAIAYFGTRYSSPPVFSSTRHELHG